MSQRSDRSKGSIYDTLFVKQMVRATKSDSSIHQSRLNVLDASQHRRSGSSTGITPSDVAAMLRKGRK